MVIKHENYDPGLKYGAVAETGDIEDDAVTTAKIVDDAVTTAKILDANVTTAKIADANITGVKLSTGGVGYYTTIINTGNTTVEQTVFGTSGLAVATTLTGMFASGLDNTTVTVSLVGGTASVGTVVLGGVVTTSTAGGTFSPTAVAASTNIFVENDNDGDVMVLISFQA